LKKQKKHHEIVVCRSAIKNDKGCVGSHGKRDNGQDPCWSKLIRGYEHCLDEDEEKQMLADVGVSPGLSAKIWSCVRVLVYPDD